MRAKLRGTLQMLHRAQVRLWVAGVVAILSLGRIGLFVYANNTLVPAQVYGWLGLLTAAALFVTALRWRSRLAGRAVAALGACILAGLGADVLPAMTSALILFWLSLALVAEAVGNHEC